MSRWTAFGLGVLARLLSTLAGEYALWLCRRLSAGEEPRDFPKDLRAFAAWLVRQSAAQLCQVREERSLGPRYAQGRYPEDRHPEEHEGLDDDLFPR